MMRLTRKITFKRIPPKELGFTTTFDSNNIYYNDGFLMQIIKVIPIIDIV